MTQEERQAAAEVAAVTAAEQAAIHAEDAQVHAQHAAQASASPARGGLHGVPMPLPGTSHSGSSGFSLRRF